MSGASLDSEVGSAIMASMIKKWVEANRQEFTGDFLIDEPLLKHTYYRIGGPADFFAVPKALEDLQWLGRLIAEFNVPYSILGAGSNVLVSDQGLRGLVIRTHRMNSTIRQVASDRIETGASVMIFSLLREAAEKGWAGLEFLTGIPGTVGGVVTMNGGTHLGDASDSLNMVEWVRLSGGERERVHRERFVYSYRKNEFIPSDAVIWSAEWSVRPSDPAKVKTLIDETHARRKKTQPIDKPSCGSVFKNPRSAGMHAWQVIDRLGLRGHRIGGAQISDKHPNFIVNLKGAKASDVKALIELVKSRAKDELGVVMEEEVKYLGE